MPNEALSISPAGANLVKHFESCMKKCGPDRYAAYKCPAGVTTIGWGTTTEHGHKITMGLVWSQAQCDAAFLADMRIFEAHVKRLVKVKLEQWQFDALVSFTYNAGAGATPPQPGVGFSGSTLLKKVNAGDFDAAALEFHKWNKAGGKKSNGLVRRRASEALLFQNIADLNYDGKPDKVITPLDDAMPQSVDPPR
jgi:lysozyme